MAIDVEKGLKVLLRLPQKMRAGSKSLIQEV